MQQETLRYTIPSDAQGDSGYSVELTLSYDEMDQNDDGSYTVTGAQGSISILDQNNNVTRVDQVSGLAPYGGYGSNDNEIFPEGSPVVSPNGITFIIKITLATVTTAPATSTFMSMMPVIIISSDPTRARQKT